MTRRKSFVFLACALALLLACNGSSTPRPTPRPLHDESGARIVCRKFVTARLKAPATAEFGPYGTVQVRHLGAGCYEVVGYVDAQNSFGVLIRSDYICTVCSSGEQDTCVLKALVIE